MLNLRDKATEEIEYLFGQQELGTMFDRDYRTAKGFQLPKVPGGFPSPAHVVAAISSVSRIREFSDTVSRIQTKWLRVKQETNQEVERYQRHVKRMESKLLVSEANGKCQGLRSLEEKKAAVSGILEFEQNRLEALLTAKQSAANWYEYFKVHYDKLRDAQKDILALLSSLKISIATKQFDLDKDTKEAFGSLEQDLTPNSIVEEDEALPGESLEFAEY